MSSNVHPLITLIFSSFKLLETSKNRAQFVRLFVCSVYAAAYQHFLGHFMPKFNFRWRFDIKRNMIPYSAFSMQHKVDDAQLLCIYIYLCGHNRSSNMPV